MARPTKAQRLEAELIKQKDAEKIRKLKLLKLREAEELYKLQKKQYEDTHKTEFFVPFEHQERAIQYIKDGKRTVLLVGANRIGKTVFGANVVNAFSQGCECAWNKTELLPALSMGETKRGILGRILCNDWEKAARDTIVPILKEWLPAGTYETKKNNVGVDFEFTFPKTGSRFTILTYKEDTKSHEGKGLHWVWADEPPPRDKYIANRRGLVDYNGIFIMTMTAISEPWILDEIVLEPDSTTGIVADIPIEANTTLTTEAIRIFEQSLTEDEKVARIKGGWLQLTGRVWKGFDVEKHVVEPFTPKVDEPCDFQIDFHLDKPHAISFRTVNKYGQNFIFEEVWANMSNDEIADVIIKKKLSMQLRMRGGEIDPLSKGDSSYVHNRFGKVDDSFTEISRKLRKYGLMLGGGSKDEKSYIKSVESMLKGPNGIPLLYITRNCRETIKQVQRWSYDDNGKPKDDGHFPECIGRFTQTGLRYTDPQKFTRPFKQAEMGV